jgi:serine phosphatase RsbU (regulator of sigma subunit)
MLFTYRMHSIMLSLWVIYQLRFIYSLFYTKVPIQFWIISVIAVVLGILSAYNPAEYFEYFSIAYLIIYVEIPRVIVTAAFEKKEGTWIIAAAFGVFFIFGLMDNLMDAGHLDFLREIENPYAFGSISFFIAMSVFLSRDYARTNKKMAEQEIQQKVLETENARQAKELEEARQLQLSMLPKELPQVPNFEIDAYMKTATEVGGDYYDFHLAENGVLTVAIGDATGHGMKAGTMVASMKSLFGTYHENLDIPQFLTDCSHSIKRMKLRHLYMAMLVVRINGNQLSVCSAGMPPVLIYRKQTESVEEIVIKGMPLGGPSDFPYQIIESQIYPGDIILLMSDGYPELFNSSMEILDFPRVKEIFLEAAQNSPDEVITRLNQAGENWQKGKAQEDDVTFLVLKVT